VAGDRVTVRVRLFRQEDSTGSFEQSGQCTGVDALGRELAARTIETVVRHFAGAPSRPLS
jgi:hypothetical protein